MRHAITLIKGPIVEPATTTPTDKTFLELMCGLGEENGVNRYRRNIYIYIYVCVCVCVCVCEICVMWVFIKCIGKIIWGIGRNDK